MASVLSPAITKMEIENPWKILIELRDVSGEVRKFDAIKHHWMLSADLKLDTCPLVKTITHIVLYELTNYLSLTQAGKKQLLLLMQNINLTEITDRGYSIDSQVGDMFVNGKISFELKSLTMFVDLTSWE
jgi:hypothetical protein